MIITVAKGALEEYFSFLKINPYKAYSLYTFVDVKIFNEKAERKNEISDVFKLVSVGALRKQKNHKFLLEAFRQLNKKKYQLDLYGAGPLQGELEEEIREHKLNVNLKGEVRNIEKIINQYEVFVMSSTFEGFSLSVLEAMAMGIPLLLSDIPSFREQCEDTAVYFKLNDVIDFKSKLEIMASGPAVTIDIAKRAQERAVKNFSLEHHMDGLRKIYTEVLELYAREK